MNLYKDINLVVVEDGYRINTIASVITDRNGLKYIDYINRIAYERKILKIWPHLKEAFVEHNIDANITFNDIKCYLPICRVGQGKSQEIGYAFGYYYISDFEFYPSDDIVRHLDDIDYVIVSRNKIAFKRKEDLDSITTILTLLGKNHVY